MPDAARPSVLITGAARRLGETMARRFAQEGWHVVIHHHQSEEEADALAAELGSAETVSFDLGDRDAIAAICAELSARLGDWRALINCASVFELDDASQIGHAVFRSAMQVNAEGAVLLAQQYLASAVAASGRHVINVLDQKLANTNPDFFSYTMSKAALEAATAMLAVEHAASADRIHGLYPGAMLPSFDQAEQEHETSGRLNLLERLTRPEELADAAVLMASGNLASGQGIFVDSGQHLLSQERDVLFLARQ